MKKYFRHFVDAGSGRSIQGLLDELGHSGPCCYWLLLELCAEKWFAECDENEETANGVFSFHQRIIRQRLRISPTNLRRLLDICAGFGLLTSEFTGNTVKVLAPKLLESLHPDVKSHAKQARESHGKRAYTNTNTNTNTKELEEKGILGFGEPPEPESKPTGADPAMQTLIDLWNSTVTDLPSVTTINFNSECWKATRARDEELRGDLEAWRGVFTKVQQSEFLSGRSQDWRACTFAWVVRKKNFAKILAGNYAGSERKKQANEWETSAERVLEAIGRWGSWSKHQAEVDAFLGPLARLAAYVEGGTGAIRALPRNDFTIKKLAAMLKDSANNLSMEV